MTAPARLDDGWSVGTDAHDAYVLRAVPAAEPVFIFGQDDKVPGGGARKTISTWGSDPGPDLSIVMDGSAVVFVSTTGTTFSVYDPSYSGSSYGTFLPNDCDGSVANGGTLFCSISTGIDAIDEHAAKATDARTLVTLSGGSGLVPLAADAGYVYYRSGTVVARVTRTAPYAVTTLATADGGDVGQQSLTVDDANVYWGTSGGAILKVAKSGGAASTVASVGQPIVVLLAGGGRLYAGTRTTDTEGAVFSAGSDGTVRLIANVGSNITSMSVDDTYVYWSAGDAIYFACK